MSSGLQKHNRRSIRLKGYDYTQPGAYFVTLATFQRAEIFGSVLNGVMVLSPLGQIVENEWIRSNAIRQEIRLFEDEYVIMPNHLHGLVWILSASNTLPSPADAEGVRCENNSPGPDISMIHRLPKSLGSFISGFKAAVTSRAGRELAITGIWQRNYYEHILRDQTELSQVYDYIQTNPQRWEQDKLHPAA